MRLRDLPGYPRLYLDFADYAGPALDIFPLRPGREALLHRLPGLTRPGVRPGALDLVARISHSFQNASAKENPARLAQPGTVAVVAQIHPAPYGGPLSQLLQCLTAIGLAGTLEAEGCPAVPLAWLGMPLAPESDTAILDNDGQRIEISKVKPDDILSKYPSNIGKTDSFRILSESFGSGTTGSRAVGAFYSGLLAEHGLVVVDPADLDPGALLPERMRCLGDRCAQDGGAFLTRAGYRESCAAEGKPGADRFLDLMVAHAVLPVAAFVVSPRNIWAMASALPLLAEAGLEPPLVWPGLSATLVDARSRKTLQKYGLELQDLFGGPEELLARTERAFDGAGTLGRFETLLAGVDSRLRALGGLAPEGDEALAGMIADARSKMHYQVRKLRERYEASLSARIEAAARQIGRLCDSLAPDGRRQEESLAAIHLVLRYSRALLGEIVRKADIGDFQHQLIPLD